MDIDTATNMVC